MRDETWCECDQPRFVLPAGVDGAPYGSWIKARCVECGGSGLLRKERQGEVAASPTEVVMERDLDGIITRASARGEVQ